MDIVIIEMVTPTLTILVQMSTNDDDQQVDLGLAHLGGIELT
jgi:hypothetical protein